MWPVRALRRLLPEDLCACENEDFIELRCARCGWTASFSTVGVEAEEILRTAKTHVAECPARK